MMLHGTDGDLFQILREHRELWEFMRLLGFESLEEIREHVGAHRQLFGDPYKGEA